MDIGSVLFPVTKANLLYGNKDCINMNKWKKSCDELNLNQVLCLSSACNTCYILFCLQFIHAESAGIPFLYCLVFLYQSFGERKLIEGKS